MSAPRSSLVFISMLVILMVFPKQSGCTNVSEGIVATECGQDVVLDSPDAIVLVNLTFSQAQLHNASCSWLIPEANATTSNTIYITSKAEPGALACNDEVLSVSEQDPATGTLYPFKPENADCSPNASERRYNAMEGQPGFSILVSLNTTSSLLESFVMTVVRFESDELCPRNERKIVIVNPGTQYDSRNYYPFYAGLFSRFQENVECKWEFRSPDEGLVRMRLKPMCNRQHEYQGGYHFVLTNQNDSASPVIAPVCKDPNDFFFDYTSTAGSIFLTMMYANSSGASRYLDFFYSSVESCPSTPLRLKPNFQDTCLIKGSSFSAQGAGQEQTCRWEIRIEHYFAVIKLYQLEAQEFQQDCDENKDYLIVNDRKVSICNGSMFPIWSKRETMNITFHTSTTLLRRSFLLNYISVDKSPCQGDPQRNTVVDSKYGDKVCLAPIPQGDIRNGQVCQWLFTAKGAGNTVSASVDWAEAGSDTEKNGVDFNQETCSYANFRVYDGNIVSDSTKITPTCSKNKSSIMYTSTSRDMLFVYDRVSNVAESGFCMKVKQVLHSTSGGGLGRDGSWIIWATVLLGLIALLLPYEY